MKRHPVADLAIVTTVALALAAPSGGIAATQAKSRAGAGHRRTRTVTFFARVLKSTPKGLLVRTKGDRKIFFSAAELAQKGVAPKSSPSKTHKGHKGRSGRRSHTGHNSHRSHKGHHKSSRKTHTRVHGPADGAPTSTPGITINIVGLQPGVTVEITETVDTSGVVAITITIPPSSSLPEQSDSGVVTEVDSGAFMVLTPGGSDLRLNMAPATLASLNLQRCDTVNVTYHQDSELLIADTVQVTGSQISAACQSSGDVTGTITNVSDSGVTISTRDGSMSFVVDDEDITDGFKVGDVVDVAYSSNDQGQLDASDVQYVEKSASGTVTAVSQDSMTIADSSGGNSETFVAAGGFEDDWGVNPFDAVSVGDQVQVGYHVSSGHKVADLVIDDSSYGYGYGGY
jgi:hypothetical protein